jgi:hypothetical protein
MEFLTDTRQEFWVPPAVALCPVCEGPLIASCDDFEQLVPSVNLYMPHYGYVGCVRDINHSYARDEDWIAIHERVSRWLERGPVLVELT